MSNLIIFFTLLFVAAAAAFTSLVFGNALIGLVAAAAACGLVFGAVVALLVLAASEPSYRPRRASRRRRGF